MSTRCSQGTAVVSPACCQPPQGDSSQQCTGSRLLAPRGSQRRKISFPCLSTGCALAFKMIIYYTHIGIYDEEGVCQQQGGGGLGAKVNWHLGDTPLYS